jgi:hypothetical protein
MGTYEDNIAFSQAYLDEQERKRREEEAAFGPSITGGGRGPAFSWGDLARSAGSSVMSGISNVLSPSTEIQEARRLQQPEPTPVPRETIEAPDVTPSVVTQPPMQPAVERTPLTGATTVTGQSIDPLTSDIRTVRALGEEKQRNISDYYDTSARLAQVHADQDAAISEKQFQVINAYEQKAAETEKIEAQRLKESQDIVNQRLSNYDAAVNDFMKTRVDPSQFWKDEKGNTSVGKSILAMIGIVLSEFGNALPEKMGGTGGRGRNMALDIINQAVDRNISSQRDLIMQKGQKAGMVMNSYNMARQHFSDETSAVAAARAAEFAKFQSALGKIALEAKSPNERENAKLTAELIGGQRNMELDKVKNEQFGMELAMKRQSQASRQAAREKQEKEIKELYSKTIPGTMLDPNAPLPSNDTLKEDLAVSRNMKQAMNTFNEFKREVLEKGAEFNTSKKAIGTGNALNQALYNLMTPEGQRKSNDPKEWSKITGLSPDPGAWFKNTKEDLPKIEQMIFQAAQAKMTPGRIIDRNYWSMK